MEDEDLIQEDRDYFRDLVRRGQEGFALQWFRIFLLTMFIIVIWMGKGGKATLIIILLIVPLVFLMERMLLRSHEQKDWEIQIEKDEFRYSPLQKLSRQVQRASEGSETQRAFVEERIREQIIYRLKNECDLTERELRRYIEKGDKDSILEITDNEILADFLLNSTDIKSLIKEQSRAAFLGDEESEEKVFTGTGFRKKMKKVIRELEGWSAT